MLGPSSHLVGAIDKLPFISCAKNTTGAHCSEAGFPMMRGSAIAISVGDRLVRDVEHRDAVPAYAARTAVAPVGIDDVVRIPEGLNEGTLAALLGRRHRGIRKSGGSRQMRSPRQLSHTAHTQQPARRSVQTGRKRTPSTGRKTASGGQ